MNYPAWDLATALVAGGTVDFPSPPGGSLVVGFDAAPNNVVAGPARSSDAIVPNQLINVLQTGGPPPMPFMGSAPNKNVQVARVQVVVRSKVDNFGDGELLARGIRHKLHLVVIAGYTDVMAQETEPNYLGIDERQLHRWSMNFAMRSVE